MKHHNFTNDCEGGELYFIHLVIHSLLLLHSFLFSPKWKCTYLMYEWFVRLKINVAWVFPEGAHKHLCFLRHLFRGSRKGILCVYYGILIHLHKNTKYSKPGMHMLCMRMCTSSTCSKLLCANREGIICYISRKTFSLFHYCNHLCIFFVKDTKYIPIYIYICMCTTTWVF